MASIIETLKSYAEHNFNVLLVGAHGIGKTTVVEKVAKDLGLRVKYYSSSTLDPWADLVGVPVPVHDTESLKFYRPADLDDAEFVFFDELNRAHPRVLNAVLEITQKKTINGKPLPKLKMIWAAINPPGGEYDVEDLDPALVDRFHVYIHMKPEFNMEYMQSVMSEDVAKILRRWWEQDMDSNQRATITPRRLEYLGLLIDKGLEWKNALPSGVVLPDGDLRRRLRSLALGESGLIEITKESLLANPQQFVERLQKNPSESFKVKDILSHFVPTDLFTVRDVLESCPKDLVRDIGAKKWKKLKRDLYQKFISNHVNVNDYPKIYDSFGFSEWHNPST